MGARRTDPDFLIEPWASELIDYCYSGGPMPATAGQSAPPEPLHVDPPPPAPRPPRARRVRQAKPPPPPPPAAAKPKPSTPRPRRSPPPPPPREPFGFDDWRRRAAEINARLDAQILALKDQSSGTPEPFRVLGTPWPCTAEQLNARWKQLAFENHPDRGGDVAKFIKLKGAYEQAKRVQAGEPFIVFSY